ncbi:MAG TPA: DUF5668 domain-containing protein [Trueperaceae bacterium]
MATESGRQQYRSGRRGGGAWPLILILVGLLLFLGNLGWLDWSLLLALGYLWPLALMAIGVDILLKGRYRLAVIVLTVLAGIAIYLWSPGGPRAAGGTAETVAVAQTLEGAREARVNVSAGVATLRLHGSRSADLLAEGTIDPVLGQEVEQSFEVTSGMANLVLDSRGPRIGGPVNSRGGRWDLTLTGRVPLTLVVDTGIGEAELDLSDLDLVSLDLDTGVGASTVTLPATGQYDADIDTGVGAATIRLPEGLAARIVVSRGIGSISVPREFVRDEDVYESPGYDSAANRVDLRVDSGLGAVNIERVP